MNRGVFFTYPYLLCYEFITFTQHPQVQANLAQGFGDPNRQGNITATIIWFAITTGATAGLSYYKEK